MARTHVKQHYVPHSYLKAWCDPNCPSNQEPYVWTFPVNGGDAKRKAPVKLFHENEMYTRTINIDGVRERDLRIEHGLCELEGSFVRLRTEFLDRRKKLPTVPLIKLLAFVAAQKARTPRARDHQKSQWGRILTRMEDVRLSMEGMTSEERRRLASMPSIGAGGKSMSLDEVRALAHQPLQEALVPTIEAMVPLLANLNVAILCTDDPTGFVTSDEPCVWFDPEGYRRPIFYRSPALIYPSLEITMPLTPNRMLFLSRNGPSGYEDLSIDWVDELNRRTIAYANKSFVSRGPLAKPYWFEQMRAPSE